MYLITPSGKGEALHEPSFSIWEPNVYGSNREESACVQLVSYHHSDDWSRISPEFTGPDRVRKAIDFMKEIIKAMSEEPLVIEITKEGEIIKTFFPPKE